MDDKKDESPLRINSLDRFSKESSRLILEEHSHCEVPAGCGGVVLRWVNPKQNLIIHMYARLEASVFIDGQAVSSSAALIAKGRHVLAIMFSPSSQNEGAAFMFAAADRETSDPILLSTSDGTWKFTTSTPVDDTWMSTGFDDSQWHRLATLPLPEPNYREQGWWNYEELTKLGAKAIGIESSGATVFIRKEFEVKGPR